MNHSDLTGSFMLKLLYQLGIMNARIYWADEYLKEMDAGGRISIRLGDLNMGGSVIWENFEHEQERLHYEIDLQYEFLKVINLSTQLSIIDDGIDNNEDLNLFFLVSYSAGTIVHFLGPIKFYSGMDHSGDSEDSVKIAGLNLRPLPQAFIKCEYQSFSQSEVKQAVEIQAGFVF